ncbi:MAG: GNAT family N-acetyltransferase, partial [[Ruminococcus] gnavus]|nr:GNAT family N-acetyltransferase [Mediterraneibacter gnavus]
MEHQGTKTIETERLILRKFTADDLSAIFHNWTSDEKVTEFLRWPTHKSIDITKRVLVLWSSIFVTLMANKIGGLQFGIYRNCQISSRVFHTAVAALPLTKANR